MRTWRKRRKNQLNLMIQKRERKEILKNPLTAMICKTRFRRVLIFKCAPSSLWVGFVLGPVTPPSETKLNSRDRLHFPLQPLPPLPLLLISLLLRLLLQKILLPHLLPFILLPLLLPLLLLPQNALVKHAPRDKESSTTTINFNLRAGCLLFFSKTLLFGVFLSAGASVSALIMATGIRCLINHAINHAILGG